MKNHRIDIFGDKRPRRPVSFRLAIEDVEYLQDLFPMSSLSFICAYIINTYIKETKGKQ